MPMIENIFKFPVWSWHIEISSKCMLKCPRCPRTENPSSSINKELELEFFLKNFPPIFVHKFVEKIMFCGNDGDPIYSKDLIKVIEYFKKIKPSVEITIITNGSYRKNNWWIDLSNVLDHNDTVIFSIDGYDNESNNLYRVNSNWDSIELGITTLVSQSKCKTVWAVIPFSFNQDKLDLMQSRAESLGMNGFQITYSNKFDGQYIVDNKDHLKPNDQFISAPGQYSRQYIDLSRNSRSSTQVNRLILNHKKIMINKIKPKCINGDGYGLFINSLGEFYPCCWIASRYNSNANWLTLGKKFNIRQQSLMSVLNDNLWNDTTLFTESAECQSKCTT